MMETRGAVEVGSEIDNGDGAKQLINRVEVGRYGLMAHSGDDEYWRYYPYELPADESFNRGHPWLNWPHRGTNRLASGVGVGFVSLERSDPDTLAAHEAHWVKTLDLVKTLDKGQPEPMQSKPLPVAENVARMG